LGSIFKQHGESGNWVSTFAPLSKGWMRCFFKSSQTESISDHGTRPIVHGKPEAQYGQDQVLGSWALMPVPKIELPGFCSTTPQGGKNAESRKGVWVKVVFLHRIPMGSVQVQGDPYLYIDDPKALPRNLKEKYIDAINRA